MNDPNGLFSYKGEQHMYFQYNPHGNEPADISWGHAKASSIDSFNGALDWETLPVAIPFRPESQGNVMIFSGSVALDYRNATGF